MLPKGTFAVICLMTGKVITERLDAYPASVMVQPGEDTLGISGHVLRSNETEIIPAHKYTAEEIGTAISFAVGLWQVK